jgi:predicted P-loop ATPase
MSILAKYLTINDNDEYDTSLSELIDDSPGVKQRFVSYLMHTHPAIEGEHGDDTTFHAAREGKLYGLSQDTNYELMWKYFNPRCIPEWSEQELRKKVESAYTSTRLPIGALSSKQAFGKPEALTGDTLLAEEEAKGILWEFVDANPNKGYMRTLNNLRNYWLLSVRRDLTTDLVVPNELYRLIRYNEFSHQIEFTRKAPWHRGTTPIKYWRDADEIEAKVWLGHVQHFHPTTAMMHEAAISISHFYSYHPVREWLMQLVWDGKERLDTWLTNYCEAAQSDYVSTVGKCTLVAAVARVMEPGCQHDSMLILEGEQGTGKTSAVRALGGAWYGDVILNFHDKDTVQNMQGLWILEASEMEFTRRSDVAAMKRFLTLKVDNVRLAYGRNSEELPRQCVFIGTVNPGKKPSYLSDTDGNRRFWPVATRRIHLSSLQKEREQLFAEAYQAYIRGDNWHLSDPAIAAQACAEAMMRVGEDAWQEVVRSWISGGEIPKNLTTSRVAYQALNLQPRELDRFNTQRIGRVMEALGYKRARQREGKDTIHIWVKSYEELEGI